MNKVGCAFVLYLGVGVAFTTVVAQQLTPAEGEMAKTWSTTLDVDKLTDKRVFTVTATAHADENPAHIYQLTITCDGGPRNVTLSAWSTTGAPAGKMNARPIEWESRIVTAGGNVTTRDAKTGAPHAFSPVVQNEVSVPKAIRFRIDSAAVAVSRLERASDNVGLLSLSDLFTTDAPRVDSSGALTAQQERALGRLQALSSGDALTATLPKARLLVADVFPNETVEFRFDVLTPDARSALRKMCTFDAPIASETSGSPAGDVKPRVLRSAQPSYTSDAMREKIHGTVGLECVVHADGTVGDVRVVRSLDARFGLDLEAIKAARQWRFAPGTRNGVPTEMTVTIDMAFTLR